MQTINERIKMLRLHEDLTQTEFGEKIGVGIGVVKNWDYGNTVPKPKLKEQICKVFNVNMNWLEKGEGEMYAPVPNEKTEFDTYHLLISDLPDADFKKKVYNALMKLTDEQWDFLEGIVAMLTEAENAKKEEGE